MLFFSTIWYYKYRQIIGRFCFMSKYKNVILMIVAVILLGYASFISIIPSMMSKNFNIDKFEQATLKAAGLNVTFEMIDIKIKPNLKTYIVIRDLIAQYPDQQPLFSAKYIELETTPAALFKKDFQVGVGWGRQDAECPSFT